VVLERLLDLEVAVEGDLGGGDEQPPGLLGNAGNVAEVSLFQDLLEEMPGIQPVLLRVALEDRVDLSQRRAAQGVLATVGEREQRLDAAAGPGDDADGAGGGDAEPGGVADPLAARGPVTPWSPPRR